MNKKILNKKFIFDASVNIVWELAKLIPIANVPVSICQAIKTAYDQSKSKEDFKASAELFLVKSEFVSQIFNLQDKDIEPTEFIRIIKQSLKIEDSNSNIDNKILAIWYFNSAKEKYDNKQYDLALEMINKAIKLKLNENGVLNLKGNILYNLKDDESALKVYKKIISDNKYYYEAHLNIGNILFERSKYLSALKEYKMAKNIRTNDYIPYYKCAWTQLNIEDYQNARVNYQKSLQLYKNEFSYAGLGLSYYLINEHKKAIEYFENAIKINQNFPQPYIALAVCYKKVYKGKMKKILDYYNTSVEIGLKRNQISAISMKQVEWLETCMNIEEKNRIPIDTNERIYTPN